MTSISFEPRTIRACVVITKCLEWKVAQATSAAPTYFPASRNVDELRLVDGGVWAKDPTMVAYIEAVGTLKIDTNDIRTS